MKNKYIFLLIAVFIMTGGSLFGQNAQNLNFNTTVAGRLDSGSEIWYRISPSQTGFISVETTGDTDTFMEFYDSNRNLLMVDDDGGEGYNARIEYYVTAGTAYLIKVRGYNSDETGPYQISARNLPMPQPVDLRIGGTPLSAALSAGGYNWYSVRAASNGILTVETTGNLDTYIDAYNSSYKFIASDDDSGDDLNARIEIFTEANQTYLFRVRSYDSSESGRYQISAANVAVTELRAGGSSVSGTITEDGENWYSVRTTASGLLIVETTGNIDTMLEAYDASFYFIGYDDDGGVDYNARLEIVAEANQMYFFLLTAYENGRYQISAKTSAFPAPVALTIGREVSGNLGEGGSNWYSVRTTARGTLIVETTGDTDTFLEVYDSSYKFLDSDDDSGEDLNARIEFSVEANQTYIFRLKGFDSSESGRYQIFARMR